MMSDPNYDIPSWVLDKIESCDFRELSSEEQSSVLRHMKEQEYTDMRSASVQMRNIFRQEVQTSPALRANLMDAFDRKHSPVRQQFFGSGGKRSWLKAAAIIVCIISAGLGITGSMPTGTGNYNNNTGCDSNKMLRQFDTVSVNLRNPKNNQISGIIFKGRQNHEPQSLSIRKKEENELKTVFNHFRKTEQEILYSA